MVDPYCHTKTPLSTRHHKDRSSHPETRHFNTQVGELFHDGMALRPPKTAWDEPRHSREPHRSQQVFNTKKTKHLAKHHSTPGGGPSYDPVHTKSRIDPGHMSGRSPRYDSTATTPRRPMSSPGSAEKYRSHQEMCLNKRRHQTDVDGGTNLDRSTMMWSSPKYASGRGSPRYAQSRGSGSYAGSEAGSDFATTPQTLPFGASAWHEVPHAGLETKGRTDTLRMGPRNSTTPHQSLAEFNLKKQQHFVGLHRIAREDGLDPRFH